MSEDLGVSALEVLHIGHAPVLHLDLNEVALVSAAGHLISRAIIQFLEQLCAHCPLCIVSEVID